MGHHFYYYAFFLVLTVSVAASDIACSYKVLADMLAPSLGGLCVKKCACWSLSANEKQAVCDKNSAIVRKKIFQDLLQKVQKISLDDASTQCFSARCSAIDKVSRFLGPLCKLLFRWQDFIFPLRKEIDTSFLLTHAHCALLQAKRAKRPQSRVAFYILCYLLQRVWAHLNAQKSHRGKAIGPWDGRKMAVVKDLSADLWEEFKEPSCQKYLRGKKRSRAT